MLIRTGCRVLGLALIALTVPLVAAAPARAANVSCEVVELDPAGPAGDELHVVDASESVTHIYREGEEIVVSNNADRERAACAGGTPTVTTIDRIIYSTESGVPFINYSGDGPLAPGASPEAGAAEIEVTIVEAYNPRVVNVAGSGAGERIEVGQLGPDLVGVNLNAGVEAGAADADVTFTAPRTAYLRIIGKGGDDTLSALGGAPFQGPFLEFERLTIAGGPGDDVLNGGPSRDSLSGGDGNDRLFGGRGRDKLTVGPGRDLAKAGKGADTIENMSDIGGIDVDLFPDRIFGGAGNDRVSTERGVAGDRVDCGAGHRDELFGSRGDLAQRCEDVELR
jgi:RTX calcium-binding nonapeptide repeat (4 copies)